MSRSATAAAQRTLEALRRADAQASQTDGGVLEGGILIERGSASVDPQPQTLEVSPPSNEEEADAGTPRPPEASDP
jgi:hypothetical protein